jgi:hypothetical protein
MMRWKWRIARGVAVLVLAAVGFGVFIPQTRPDGKLLGRLVIAHTALSEVPHKAALSQSVPPSQSTFAVTRAAAKRNPDNTGLYAREWYISSSGPPEVGVVVQRLPTVAQAKAVLGDIDKQLVTAPSLPDETAVDGAAFSVPGVPGGRGESFQLNDSTTASKPPVGSSYTTAYRVGQVVVSELMVTTTTRRDDTPIDADSKAGYHLLLGKEPGFSMARTRLPLEASLVYLVGALVVAALAVLAPEFTIGTLRRRRRLHQEREQRRAREQYLVRGRRTVRRRRAPAWSQPRKR